MSLFVLISAFYVYIHRIYTYIVGDRMKRKKISSCESIRNFNEIEEGQEENNSLLKSDIHYHFYYLNVEESKKNLNDFKINCYYCDRKIDNQTCYVAYDSLFCSIFCQKKWLNFNKSNI